MKVTMNDVKLKIKDYKSKGEIVMMNKSKETKDREFVIGIIYLFFINKIDKEYDNYYDKMEKYWFSSMIYFIIIIVNSFIGRKIDVSKKENEEVK